MLPTSEGVWRWKRKDDGREFDLPVYHTRFDNEDAYLRIRFLNVHYDIDDFLHGTWLAKTSHNPDSHITKQIAGWIHPDDYKEALVSA